MIFSPLIPFKSTHAVHVFAHAAVEGTRVHAGVLEAAGQRLGIAAATDVRLQVGGRALQLARGHPLEAGVPDALGRLRARAQPDQLRCRAIFILKIF